MVDSKLDPSLFIALIIGKCVLEEPLSNDIEVIFFERQELLKHYVENKSLKIQEFVSALCEMKNLNSALSVYKRIF